MLHQTAQKLEFRKKLKLNENKLKNSACKFYANIKKDYEISFLCVCIVIKN